MTAAAVRPHRLFFALWPGEATRRALYRETRAVVRHCGGRPVATDQLHLTLLFLGQVPGEAVGAVTTAAVALDCPGFTLVFDRYGWFESAQVLWLGCSAPPAPLPTLAAGLARQVRAVTGLVPDPKPFQPHVTLARKVRNPPQFPPPRPVAWPVDGFALVESVTAPEGARYTVLETFPIQSPV